MKSRVSLLMVVLLVASAVAAQTSSISTQVPHLVKVSGVLNDATGKALTGAVGVTFSLYKDQEGGAALWMETQNVQVNGSGHYSVTLGESKSEGVPADLFAAGQARWLGVQAAGQSEQPRILLLSVPYALKAGDADTVGGLPASAFVLAGPVGASSGSLSGTAGDGAATASGTNGAQPAVSGTGTTNFVPLWTSSTALGNSVLFQSGSGATAKVGIGTMTPGAALDIKGGANVGGVLLAPAIGAATASAGKNSQAHDMVASSYSSSKKAAVAQDFRWQVEPLGNNTASPSGTLNLLFGAGGVAPAETGLKLSSKGIFTFAAGQTFPGTGSGTITGVTAGADLTGGGTSGNVTLSLDTTKVPLLASANTFTANQTVNGTLSASSSAGTGVAGTSGSGSGVTGTSTSAIGVLGSSSTNVGVYGTSGSYIGLFGQSTSNYGSYGVSSNSYGMVGVSANANGIYGQGANIGIYGVSTSPFVNSGWGVQGISSNNVGVYGGSSGASSTGASYGTDAGVWGDTGDTSAFTYSGVIGTADNKQGGAFYNNGLSYASLSAANFTSSSGAIVFSAGLSSFCITDNNGNLFCTGSKSAMVPVDKESRQVALYAVEAPENWFEDAGSGLLTNGEAVVNLEPVFGQTVNTGIEYHVFLTPKGDCKGLYVAKESPTSFEVRELGGGVSSIAFDYRIMAKRKGYENIRLADKTKQFHDQQTRVAQMLNARAAKPSQPRLKTAVK
jgi:hypothetical protein